VRDCLFEETHEVLRPRRATGLGLSALVHAFGSIALMFQPVGAVPAVPLPDSRIVAIFEMPPPDEVLIEDDPIDPAELSGLDVPGLPFNIPKIAARKKSLFPFLTLELTFLQRIDRDARDAAVHVTNPLAASAGSAATPPLRLEADALQRVVDDSWSRRDRWRQFAEISGLLNAHDANAGDVPAVLRAYLDQNLLQPFCDGRTKDARFWAMLENAADHVAFIELVRSYAKQHPASRTTTELLFLLDELTQASRDAMLTLLETDPARDLIHTATVNPPSVKLAAEISQQYRAWLRAESLGSVAAVRERFDQVRLRILATIMESTPNGYREADARYLAGEIFLRQSNLADALEWWTPMRPAAGDSYLPASARIRAALQPSANADAKVLRRILESETGRWKMAMYERMRRFGHKCDTY
jgi:hypothetical protein